MTALVVALAVAVLLLAVLVAGLLRSHAEILKALHELGAGLELDRAEGPVDVTIDGVRRPRRSSSAETADAVSGQTLEGEAVALSLTTGTDTLLAFLSSGCTTCGAFWEAFAEQQVQVPGDARLVVVTKSLDEESASALAKRAPRHVPLVASSSAWEDFGVPGSPYFVYVDGTGRIVGEGSAATWPAVATLMGQAHADDAHRNGRLSREGRDDAALAAAGIRPGDASL
ncbi:MAG: hypothetical protein JWM62_456 [Frankiales bacterium]|nr:hypothetical protein [Frankiales bacterium]